MPLTVAPGETVVLRGMIDVKAVGEFAMPMVLFLEENGLKDRSFEVTGTTTE